MRWLPLPTTLAYALIGPAIGVGVFLVWFSQAIVNLGPFSGSAFWELLFAIYIIGAPPMALTGLLVGVAASREARFPTLTMLSAIYGGMFAIVSALFWSFLGAIGADPGFGIIAAIAAIAAVAAFITALILGLVSLFRRRRASQ